MYFRDEEWRSIMTASLAARQGARQRDFREGGSSRNLFSQPPRLAGPQPRQRRPLGRRLDRRQQAEQRQHCAEYPECQVEAAYRQQQGAAAEQFQDGAGLTALG